MGLENAKPRRAASKRAELMAELGLLETPVSTLDGDWEKITIPRLAAFVVGVVIFLVLILKSEPGFIFLLDHANLLFHEAGHPIYGLLSERLAVYGGTLGQLTFPVILAISFYRKGEPIPFAASWIWFFENFLNIARYMADARVQVLPLVGGGDHDWAEIFSRWNLLSRDSTIASIARSLGWVGMAGALVWILYRAMKDYHQVERAGECAARTGVEPKGARTT
ncbi:MAG TPA: hypothetical protein VGR78_05045 [Verrucomicrobiae bacterium]|nr:hypothetical protein [Verrucomicrobiae bacterium]